MKIGAFSRHSGLSIDTIRYYEKVGLLKPPHRDKAGCRIFDENELNWLRFLGQLKATGMTISQMVYYSDLRNMGSSTYEIRAEMLARQREKVAKQLVELENCRDLLDDKISLYKNLIKERDDDE